MARTLKNVLKSVGKFFGYKIEFNITGQKQLPIRTAKLGQKSIVIEFIGPPGVGKTTLLKYTLKSSTELKSKIKLFDEVGSSIKRRYKAPSHLYGIHKLILEEQIKFLAKRDLPPLKKSLLIQSSKEVILKDFLITNYLSESLLIADEGVLHKFSHVLNDIYTLHPREFLDFTTNRIIIFCKSQPTKILENIRTRQENGILINKHENWTDNEIIEDTISVLETEQELVDNLEQINMPILTVDTSKPLETTCNKIKYFLFENI